MSCDSIMQKLRECSCYAKFLSAKDKLKDAHHQCPIYCRVPLNQLRVAHVQCSSVTSGSL
jgi:hypothetical protein